MSVTDHVPSTDTIGVGVGPGDPELLTTRALRVLREADRVLGPSFSVDAVGRAESIVRQADPTITVERVVVEMRTPTYDAAADRIVSALDAGERVAFITLGDPTIYSTFSSIAAAVLERRPATPVDTVPGIMAFQDLAARAGVVVIDGTERLQLVSAVDGPDAVDDALADEGAAVVVYKGGRHLPAIAERLEEHAEQIARQRTLLEGGIGRPLSPRVRDSGRVLLQCYRTLAEVIRRLTIEPSRTFGLPCGTLAVGAPADLVVLDLDASWTVNVEQFASRGKNTPLDGHTLQGRVLATMVDGLVVNPDVAWRV